MSCDRKKRDDRDDENVDSEDTVQESRQKENRELQTDLAADSADYKILAKILTERLKKVLTRLVGAEQQGFIQAAT